MPILRMENLVRTFPAARGLTPSRAVDGVSFSVEQGEAFAVVGESGSGKSTLARLILGLQQPDQGGEIEFEGRTMVDWLAHGGLRSRMTAVFQEPEGSLNPRMRVGSLIAEPLIVHRSALSRRERSQRVRESLEEVGLSSDLADRFPRQLSTGQQQRVNIARAMVGRPRFVVLDEPTSSLDVSAQSSILQLLERLQRDHGLAYLFISHDLHTARRISQRIAVMYRGQILEFGPTRDIFESPAHPYTLDLLSSMLSPDPTVGLAPVVRPAREVLTIPPASVEGCAFYARCAHKADPRCRDTRPPMRQVSPGHWVSSFYAVNDSDSM